ncbi:MAG: hypothetical protein EP297_08920, partial [Gammaproteobacteria bacterium]
MASRGKQDSIAKMSLFSQITTLFSGRSRYEEIKLHEPYLLGNTRVRISAQDLPVHIRLAKVKLEFRICEEALLDASSGCDEKAYILMEENADLTTIQGFQRLCKKGNRLILGKYDAEQTAMFNYPQTMDLRRLSITHDGDALIFNSLVSDAEIHLTSLSHQRKMEEMVERRRNQLKIIRGLYGGSIEPLAPAEALSTLQAVNEILETDAYRPVDGRGKPGGIVELPGKLIPIIIGDLHAQVDNLLTLLSHNGFMESLEQGKAALIILGDAVHSEMDGQLEEMDSSLLMTDLILRLKLRFPQQVFYIRGNHDSFSSDIFKAGVAQSLMWERAVNERGGEDYLKEMNRFYDLLPYLVISSDFIA